MLSRYEDQGNPEGQGHNKSTGQLGDSSDNTTTDPTKTAENTQRQAERGEKTAENIRYGQTISEGGMGGMTTTQENETTNEGYGKVADRAEESNAGRVAAGYGGGSDMDRNVGA